MSSKRHNTGPARLARRDQLRAQAREADPTLTDEQVEVEVERLLFAQRSSGGKESARRRAAELAAAREILAAVPAALEQVELARTRLQSIATLAEAVA